MYSLFIFSSHELISSLYFHINNSYFWKLPYKLFYNHNINNTNLGYEKIDIFLLHHKLCETCGLRDYSVCWCWWYVYENCQRSQKHMSVRFYNCRNTIVRKKNEMFLLHKCCPLSVCYYRSDSVFLQCFMHMEFGCWHINSVLLCL